MLIYLTTLPSSRLASLTGPSQLIFSFFKTLTGQPITIELKNDVAITGTLKSVDQFLNFRIENLRVVGNESVERAMLDGGGAAGGEVDAGKARWPHLVSRLSGSDWTNELNLS